MRLRRAYLLPLTIALPFVVGFDIPDTSGTYVRASAGRGTYHLSGCHRDFDSEYWEGQVALRHTMETGARDPDASVLRRLMPGLTTLGTHADFIVQDLTVVMDSAKTDNTLGDTRSPRAFEGGAYVGFDWERVGVNLGLSYALFNLGVEDAEKKAIAPVLGLRLGVTRSIYLTAEAAGSNPYLSGGGGRNAGIGMKLGDYRAWAGLGDYNWSGATTLGMIRLDRASGPWAFSFAGQIGGQEVKPAGLGIDREYGLSLGLSYRLSSLP
ncbi:MAG: hypothetical protein JF616_05055 [Fibrobacteres bacterium]|nr:hypothetical protein [Fibrobacterota bacterium]